MGKDKHRKIKSELNKMIVRQEIENRRILKENKQGVTQKQNDEQRRDRRMNRRNKQHALKYNPHGNTYKEMYPGRINLFELEGASDVYLRGSCGLIDSGVCNSCQNQYDNYLKQHQRLV